MTLSIVDVRKLGEELSNWGRWGASDEVGTINFITRDKVREGGACIRKGRVFSLAVPFDRNGPQSGLTARFNPMLFLTRDGGDIETKAIERLPHYCSHGEVHSRFTDDVLVMPSQAGTQWDALAHCIYDGKMYNGFPASSVASWGTIHCGVEVWRDRIATRGVLLDIARWRGKDWLEPGTPISDTDLAECAKSQGVEVREGDIVLIRTGHVGLCHARKSWGDYAGGNAPGLALSACRWIHANRVAGIATDTWGMEVRPNETPDVHQPLHIVLIVYMGLLVGEIFDLEALAKDCAADGQYDFQFIAPPLPVTGAVGSPLNPIAIK